MRSEARQYSLPKELSEWIQLQLNELEFNINKPEILAQAIHALSDIYTSRSGQSGSLDIWTQVQFRAAFLTYYLPLNSMRLMAAYDIGAGLGFFDDVEKIYDIGSGPGTAWLTLNKYLQQEWNCFDHSRAAVEWGKVLCDSSCALEWHRSQPRPSGKNNLGLFSYSLNELDSSKQNFDQFDSLMIIEPATHQDGRKLLEIRAKLIDQGFYMWAPCVHQKDCPLLTQSKKDWCHDRIRTELPNWFYAIENHLPMKNQSLTFSYLLAKKSPPSSSASGTARLIGDGLQEKGKTRQLICRSSEREFLTWMKKDLKKPEPLPRGLLVSLPDEAEKKGNELRIKVDPGVS